MESKGLRYNSGKNRLDLVPPELIEEVGKILTFGATKYESNNWKKGIKFSNIISSLKRHLNEFEKGNDFDIESGELHLSHAACNIAFLLWNIKHRPDLDDRYHYQKQTPNIGLDIDDVLADFITTYCAKFELPIAEFWSFDPKFKERMEILKDDKEFWLSLPKLIEPSDLKFEPHCYITARSIPNEWTEQWLYDNGFPHKPVISVSFGESKVEAAINAKVDIMIDDRYENYKQLNENGICCFLMDQPHNRRYDVGYRRIMSLKEFNI